MQDPRKALEKAGANDIMNMFWGHCDDERARMQTWNTQTGRVLHVQVNMRSGADKRFLLFMLGGV